MIIQTSCSYDSCLMRAIRRSRGRSGTTRSSSLIIKVTIAAILYVILLIMYTAYHLSTASLEHYPTTTARLNIIHTVAVDDGYTQSYGKITTTTEKKKKKRLHGHHHHLVTTFPPTTTTKLPSSTTQSIIRMKDTSPSSPLTTTSNHSMTIVIDGCTFLMHTSSYLGEYAGNDQTSYTTLHDAFKRCITLGWYCKGVTCPPSLTTTGGCTVRAGTPYLATSTEGEVSYVKTCPTSSPQSAAALAPGVSGEITTDVTKGSGQHPVLKNSAIVVMAHDREQYLASCLESLLALDGIQLFTMYVSLDEVSAFNRMEGVIREKERQHGRKIGVWHRPLIPPSTAYDTLPSSKIAAHYRYALEQVYTVHQHDYVIMVENDLIFAPDFLTLFINTAKLLEDDDSLYCISGWNDNGFIEYATNETTLYRTHFFPGLGWMAHRSLWDRIRWKWPNAPTTGWDHWMRLSTTHEGRECIYPEVPRSRHIAVEGSNVHAADQAGIYQRMALSRGGGGEYDEALRKMISLAIPSTLDQLTNILIQGQQAGDNNAGGLVPMDRIYMIPYLREEYPIIQQRLNLFPNYFRGQHKGVVIINIHAARTRLIFIDRRSGHQWLPNNISVTPPPLMTYLPASRGVSCNDACHSNNGMVCYDHLLEFANDCHVMLTHFPCEQGCGHQLGLELPAYVLDGGLHTFGQCLVTDHGAPSCLTSHPSTARMCVCLPPPPPSSTTNNMNKDDRPISNHQHEEEEEEDMIDFLGPNHPLMAPLQTALLNRMMKKLDRISIVLKDKEEEGRRLRQHREELGAQLYTFQQQLGSLQSNIEEANHSREDTDDKVKKVKERTEVLIEEYDRVSRDTRDQMVMLEKVREERNRVLHVVEQLKRYREDLQGNIALKKRAAYKGESNVQVVEKDKAQQDLLIDELTRALKGKNEDIALLEGQVEVQIKERDNARIMIREATQALAEINDERKVIKQEVGSNYIGLSRRDQTMQKIMESTNAITADILSRIGYIGQETTIIGTPLMKNQLWEETAMQEGNIEKEGDITQAHVHESHYAKVCMY
ncbi:hypothetical protein FOZ60_012428 [Perkinsus olseni]|uniref:alpha-1,3-mannosyl-glycoprotein 2-beta-N-acetylglucosaminyltransferase n=1 Tax=Perkinsus olseni TaxID=32597 RepID=A0A7J6NBI3_PEROL|nr:hypothetical protein FOZ60_012428 [Perkinsus olseni]